VSNGQAITSAMPSMPQASPLRDKNQRPGRNPKTGEEIPISARRVVTFRPGQKLKARVEAYVGAKE
jgi:integration host factor subunit alpha